MHQELGQLENPRGERRRLLLEARDELTIVGDLTIRGVTKAVTLKGEMSQEVKDPWGNQRTSIVANGKISREQFGLVWNMALEFGGVMVSDEVKLHIEGEFVKAAG